MAQPLNSLLLLLLLLPAAGVAPSCCCCWCCSFLLLLLWSRLSMLLTLEGLSDLNYNSFRADLSSSMLSSSVVCAMYSTKVLSCLKSRRDETRRDQTSKLYILSQYRIRLFSWVDPKQTQDTRRSIAAYFDGSRDLQLGWFCDDLLLDIYQIARLSTSHNWLLLIFAYVNISRFFVSVL